MLLRGFYERKTLFACILATGAIFIDISIVNVVLPDIRNDLQTSLAQEQWIVNAYLITMTAFVLPAGVMGDVWGHKRMLQVGLVAFIVATLLVGLAPSADFLIGARALQWVAAALLTPASIAILRTSVAPERQARAIGIWVTGTSLSASIAPAFGGVVGGLFGWRWAFLVVIPALMVAVWFARGIIDSPQAKRRIDLVGGAIIATAIALLTAGLIEWPTRGLLDPLVLGLLAAGSFVVLVFVWHERRFPEPMIPPRAVRDRLMNRVHVYTILAWSTPLTMGLLISIRLQSALGYGPIMTGFLLLPMSLMVMLTSSRLTAFAAGNHMQLMLRLGPLLTAVSVIPALFLADGRVWVVIPAEILLGLGMACMAGPVTHAVLQLSPAGDEGMQSAINLAAARFGTLMSIALLGIAATLGWSLAGGPANPGNALEGASHFADGAYLAGLVLSALLALAAIPFATAARRARAAND
ncbi:MAG: MFS transporter [Thermoleophilia bacterium]|nr:MFS transporter [Thermoleophilia bacterium]